MSDEIEYLEEDEESSVEDSDDKKTPITKASKGGETKQTGKAVMTAVAVIGIQLFGVLLAVVIGLAYFITMEVIGADDYFPLILGMLAGIILLIVNAWIFYFRDNKAAAGSWSLGIYFLLSLYFMDSWVLNFTVVVLVLATIYIIVGSDFLKKKPMLLGILMLVAFIFFFFQGSDNSSRSSAASGPSATPRPSATPAPTKFRPTDVPVTAAPTLMPPDNPSLGSTWLQTIDGMTLVYVPAGEFKMGGQEFVEETPIHTVYLDAYWIDKTEVTNAMYAKCVSAGVCDPPERSDSYSHDDYYVSATFDDYPVMYVSWEDANTYCTWAGRRLPTEAEWEKAARGDLEGKKYPWGDMDPACGDNAVENGANCYGTAEGNPVNTSTEKVATYLPNGYGIYDMSGNLFEWVADWYDAGYYANSPLSNPLGPDTGTDKVVRGGDWSGIKTASRTGKLPTHADYNPGFRCARSD